jgi:hypothetical protein
MPKISASPFNTLPADFAGVSIEATRGTDEKVRPNDFVKGYTCDRPLAFQITASISCPDIFELLELSKDARIVFVARGRCKTTRFTISEHSAPLDGAKGRDVKIGLTIPAGMIAEQLSLEYFICLDKKGAKNEDFTPQQQASILWERKERYFLEGLGAMFPTTMEEFKDSEGGKLAAWRVDWSKTSLHGSPSRVRLVLNSLNKSFIHRIDPPGEGNPDETAMQMLYHGVALSLLEHAVRNADDLAREKYEEGTLGQYIQKFLNLHFGINYTAVSASSLAKRYQDNPEIVKAILQSKLPLTALHD